jgi:hypothetical protein
LNDEPMWTQEIIAGRRADIFEPADRPRFGLLYLHPENEEPLRVRPAYTRLLEELRLSCVCPHAGPSWWLDRRCPAFDAALTPEKYLIDHLVPLLRQRWPHAARALGVCGIGMGGQGALRLAFRHSALFPAAAAIAPALDFHEIYGRGTPLDDIYDSKEQARQDTALMHAPREEPLPQVYFSCDPDDVEWHRGSDRLHEKLSALGVEHTADLTTQAGGHSDAYFDRMAEPALRFLVAALEKESRRLL